MKLAARRRVQAQVQLVTSTLRTSRPNWRLLPRYHVLRLPSSAASLAVRHFRSASAGLEEDCPTTASSTRATPASSPSPSPSPRGLYRALCARRAYWDARMDVQRRYDGWTTGQLVARIMELEGRGSAAQGGKGGMRSGEGTTDTASASAAPAADDTAAAATLAPTPAATPVGAETGESTSPRPTEASPAPAAPTPGPTPPSNGKARQSSRRKEGREFNISDLPMRKIALRFAYDGENYSGLATQGDGAPLPATALPDAASGSGSGPSSSGGSSWSFPLPTVEDVLWQALCMARLVDPKKGMSGAGWSRCGRTDRGVSAAGQVVALWVRSRKVDEREVRRKEEERLARREAEGRMKYLRVGVSNDGGEGDGRDALDGEEQEEGATADAGEADSLDYSPLQPGVSASDTELPYVQNLNRLLPESIRVLSWSPVRPSFNARFDCRYRHYKYFFTSGPPPHLLDPPADHPSRRHTAPRMDIPAMREAASYLLGEHDFRNLCKVDASKQIKNFRRRIDGVSIDRVESGWPTTAAAAVAGTSAVGPAEHEHEHEHEHEQMYVLNLRGTAFLYHQVRHIMAVLFLVGAGMERPTVVRELLNTEKGGWAADEAWLRRAGVDTGAWAKGGAGAEAQLPIVLPGSTATEIDGATAITSAPQLASPGAAHDGAATDFDAINNGDDRDDAPMQIYETKPMYELSADRPLVLWECGFRPQDVSWRVGPWDGASPTSLTKGDSDPTPTDASREAMITASTMVCNDLYRTWVRSAISAEMHRHFLLAAGEWPPALAAAASQSTTPSGTLYADARWPRVAEPASVSSNEAGQPQPLGIPFGNGSFRPVTAWGGLAGRKREESVEEKNARWAKGKGARSGRVVKASGGVVRGGAAAGRGEQGA